MVMCRDKQHSSKGFPPSQEGLPKLWRRNKTVSLESVPISYLTMQRMSLSLLWPFPSHILRPPFPSRLVTDLTVLTPPPPTTSKEKRGGALSPLGRNRIPPPSSGPWNRPNLPPPPLAAPVIFHIVHQRFSNCISSGLIGWLIGQKHYK